MNAVAARRVAASANSPAEAREFLLMLGIIDEAGQLLPDPTRDVAIGHVNRLANAPKVGGRNRFMDRPERSTAPSTLQVLAAPQPTVRKQTAPRTASQLKGPPQDHNLARMQPCGTEAAARRHVAKREPVCDTCQRGRDERRREKSTRLVHNAECGTRGGYEKHRRQRTTICPPCRAAYNQARRDERAAARGKREAANPVVHGTSTARKRHYKEGTPVCEECRAFKLAADAMYAARKKAQNGASK
jgi:hypothetical protein